MINATYRHQIARKPVSDWFGRLDCCFVFNVLLILVEIQSSSNERDELVGPVTRIEN